MTPELLKSRVMNVVREDFRLTFELNPEMRPLVRGHTVSIEGLSGEDILPELSRAHIELVVLDGERWERRGQVDSDEAAVRVAGYATYAIKIGYDAGPEVGEIGEGWKVVHGLDGIVAHLIKENEEVAAEQERFRSSEYFGDHPDEEE
jgi:hypothetical protein